MTIEKKENSRISSTLGGFDADILIVGTGMGGGAAGYWLAKAGYKVLFIERGLSQEDWDPLLSAQYSETFFNGKSKLERSDLLRRSARAAYTLNRRTPVLGGGQGGSSAVYGAGLLRFHPSDFRKWPFDYQALRKYYEHCDELFQPRGTQDPLGERRNLIIPSEMSNSGKEIFQYLIDQKLNPYRTPIAYKAVAGCQECFGSYCAKDCKRTSGNVFVAEAVKRYDARALYEVGVTSLIMEGRKCRGVRCMAPSGPFQINATHVFLGAGALITPIILLQSRSDAHPNGVGNQDDLVGRYLMRHLIDFFYVKTRATDYCGRKLTEISLSDYYRDSNEGWGIVNIVGGIMSPEIIARVFSEQHFEGFPWLGRAIRPLVKGGLSYLMKDRILLTTIMEDESSFGNRIRPDSTIDNVLIDYRISRRDQKRLKAFRREMKRVLKGLSPNLIKVADENMMISHACGTCRMGNDPAASVVNSKGRVHSTDNVFVVDASIFPSSGAANPSLTVAACSLKIADEFQYEHRQIGSRS